MEEVVKKLHEGCSLPAGRQGCKLQGAGIIFTLEDSFDFRRVIFVTKEGGHSSPSKMGVRGLIWSETKFSQLTVNNSDN